MSGTKNTERILLTSSMELLKIDYIKLLFLVLQSIKTQDFYETFTKWECHYKKLRKENER